MLNIGVFDSGLGGLTVVKEIQKLLKNVNLFYIADTQNAPYGSKTPQEILNFSLNITEYFLKNHHIEVLIIACNTATAFAINTLREKYPTLIIIGTEPGLKPAIYYTKSNAVGVLATPATLKGKKYQQLSKNLFSSKNIFLHEQACDGLVEQIEKGEINSSKTYTMLEKWLIPMKKNNVDTIVLGCTHYPLVSKEIQAIMGKKITLINTGEAIAKHLLNQCVIIGHKNHGSLEIFIFSTAFIDKDSIITILNNIKLIKQINII